MIININPLNSKQKTNTNKHLPLEIYFNYDPQNLP